MPNSTQAAFGQLGMQAAGGVVSQGMGMLLGNYNDRRQRMQQDRLMQIQMRGQKEMTDYNYEKQLQMWKDTNYEAQIKQLEKANLNPALIYGMSGGGGVTTGSGSGNVSGGTATGSNNEGMALQSMNQQTIAQLALLDAQKKNIEADTANKVATKPKTEAETSNINADTENKILTQVITKYLGLEASDQYERIKKPNRGIEAKTWEDELSARQGVAGTIYELWQEGKLYDKSATELEQLILQKAKTQEEINKLKEDIKLIGANLDGVKLDNAIKELENKMQQETGIDRNAPTWLKIIGRFFTRIVFK